MVFLAKTVSLLICIWGLVLVIFPDQAKSWIGLVKADARAYGIGVVRFVFGGILLFASPQCHIPPIAIMLGILFLLSGSLIFVMGLEKVREWIGWLEGQSLLVFRLLGLIVICFSVLILYTL